MISRMARRWRTERVRRARLGTLLIVAGALALLAPLAFTALAWRATLVPAPQRDNPVIAAPAPAPAPAAAPAVDTPPAPTQGYRLEVPRLGLDYAVLEGIDNEQLALGPGHYPGTAAPGQEGNAAIAGHRTVRGKPSYFYNLHRLEPGDAIRVSYPGRALRYTVEQVYLTAPTDLAVLAPTDAPTLTLTTCDPPGSDERRLIVRARLAAEAD